MLQWLESFFWLELLKNFFTSNFFLLFVYRLQVFHQLWLRFVCQLASAFRKSSDLASESKNVCNKKRLSLHIRWIILQQFLSQCDKILSYSHSILSSARASSCAIPFSFCCKQKSKKCVSTNRVLY